MNRLALLLTLCSCATQQVVVRSEPPAAPPTPTATCPTTAPSSAAFAPESVFGAKVEKLCLLGAGDETSLRLREAVAPREGTTFDADGVRSDLTALVDTGLISQAAVFAELLDSKRVIVTYVVVERALIDTVRVEGGTSLPAEIRQQLEGKNFRDTLTQRNQRRDALRDFYDSKGFHDATIDFRAAGTELIISITEGPRFVVEAVRFDGAKAVSVKDLEKVVATKAAGPVLPDVLEVDVMRLTSLYFDRGHVTVSVTTQQRPHGETPGPTDIVFTIAEGPVFRIGAISLKGLPLDAKALGSLETKKGAVFSRTVIQRDLEKLRERAKKQGKDVEVLPMTDIDQTKHTVGLTFELTEKH